MVEKKKTKETYFNEYVHTRAFNKQWNEIIFCGLFAFIRFLNEIKTPHQYCIILFFIM